MTGTLQPLDSKFAIVDARGNPTNYFIRWAQQKQIDIGNSALETDLQLKVAKAGDTMTGELFLPNMRIGLTGPSLFPGVYPLEVHSNGFTGAYFAVFANAAAPEFVGIRSRGADSAMTTVADGDFIMSYFGRGYDGTGLRNAAGVRFKVQGAVGTNVLPTALQFWTNPGASNFAQVAQFDPAGNFQMTSGGVSTTVIGASRIFYLPQIPTALLPVAGTAGRIAYDSTTGAPKFDNGTAWTAFGGGGGTKPWYWKPPASANFSTMYASFRGGNIANVPTFTDDTNVGLTWTDPSADNGYMKAFGRPIPLANQGPGTTFTITAHVLSNSISGNDQFGIWARCSATKYVFFNLFNRSGSINIQRAFYNAGWNDGVFTLPWIGQGIWLRIAISNQTTSYYISVDGRTWIQCYTTENLLTAAYTDYGFCIGRFTLTQFSVTCDNLTSDEYP